MNQADLIPIHRQVEHNQRAGWSWCLLRPAQVGDLIASYQDLCVRLEEIAALIQEARYKLADHHLPEVGAVLDKMEELAR